MLRITPTERPNGIELTLEGRLAGPWVEVLRKAWTDTLGHQRHVSLDLRNVSFVDAKGRSLLLNMQREGVGLIKASAFLREMLKLSETLRAQQDSHIQGE